MGPHRRMLEDSMSVWPNTLPVTPSLSTAEGALVSVSIHVEPHCLESLLEALALVSFPINPQIYHEAALVYRFADGREETESVTLSLIHISEPTRRTPISYAVFC